MQTTKFTASEARSFLNHTIDYRNNCINTLDELNSIMLNHTEQLKNDLNNEDPNYIIDSRTALINRIVNSIHKVEAKIQQANEEIKYWKTLCPPLKKDYNN